MRVVAGCARALRNPKVMWRLLHEVAVVCALLLRRSSYRTAAVVLQAKCTSLARSSPPPRMLIRPSCLQGIVAAVKLQGTLGVLIVALRTPCERNEARGQAQEATAASCIAARQEHKQRVQGLLYSGQRGRRKTRVSTAWCWGDASAILVAPKYCALALWLAFPAAEHSLVGVRRTADTNGDVVLVYRRHQLSKCIADLQGARWAGCRGVSAHNHSRSVLLPLLYPIRCCLFR